jgi:hypothetical protein
VLFPVLVVLCSGAVNERVEGGSLDGSPVQESDAGGSPCGDLASLLLVGWRGSFGFGGRLESGAAGSIVPRWRQASTASLHPGSPELGARPRSMVFQRLLHLVLGYECLLWLFQMPCGHWASSDLWFVVASAFRRWPAATKTKGVDLHRE